MRSEYLKNALRFCCIIDDAAAGPTLTEQAEIALKAGATLIRYNGSGFSPEQWKELQALCRRCRSNGVPLLIRDHFLLAKALGADGIHLTAPPETVDSIRDILGPEAIVGATEQAGMNDCIDYFEFAPFDSNAARKTAHIPVITGEILEPAAARRAVQLGADGIAVGSDAFQSENPAALLTAISESCRTQPRSGLQSPWQDEFGLIDKIIRQAPGPGNDVIVPPGDDACLLSPLSHPIISTDTQKEGVHFRLDWQTPEEIGEKAVSITLSDLAASYARPAALFVNIALPASVSDAFVAALYRGIGHALKGYGCGLGGGNISSGKELSLDLFAVGQGKETMFPRRSGAQPGFELYATGPLGIARAGLEALLKNEGDFPELIERFKHPRARFDASEILATHGVSCAMDISDGLSGDAGHMADASNLSIELDVADLSHPESLLSFCRKYDLNPDSFALAGGEDYELLFACPPEIFPDIKASLPEAVRVGRCLPRRDRRIIAPDMALSSYRHGS